MDEQEKTFTQADIDRIVGERLSRDGVQDSKEIVELLKDFDYTGTPAEVKAALKIQADIFKTQKAENAKQMELDSLIEKAAESGTSPALEKRIKDLEDKQAASNYETIRKQAEIEKQILFNAAWEKQVEDFSKKYPDTDLGVLNEDPKFLKFAKGKNNTPFTEIYEDYLEIIGETAEEATKKANSKAERSTGSASGKGDGSTHGLTPNQQALAKENGMSFKEYSEIYHTVKK